MHKVMTLAGSLFTLALLSTPALAGDDCTPRLMSSMPLIAEPDGRYAIQVAINGVPHRMLLATADVHTMLSKDFVASADIKQRELPERKNFGTFGGEAIGIAVVDSMAIGASTAEGVQTLIGPGSYKADSEVVGTLGVDLLANFDVDLDFKSMKLNLFGSNPCDGRPVYWSDRYTDLSFDGDEAFAVPMTLDGKTLRVAISTLTPHSRMRFDVANEQFGLSEKSPGLVPDGTDDEGHPRYRYTFAALDAGKLAIARPVVLLHGSAGAVHCDSHRHGRSGPLLGMTMYHTCHSDGDMELGLQDMQATHLYFAYKAKRIYLTVAAAN